MTEVNITEEAIEVTFATSPRPAHPSLDEGNLLKVGTDGLLHLDATDLPVAGGGMSAAVYDPSNIQSDVYDLSHHHGPLDGGVFT